MSKEAEAVAARISGLAFSYASAYATWSEQCHAVGEISVRGGPYEVRMRETRDELHAAIDALAAKAYPGE